jgi:SAM-dependent methyltransferase
VDEAAYDVIAEVERTHWWYSARREVLGAVLDAELGGAQPHGFVLDVGCGTGAGYPVVARCGTPVGMDPSERALRYAAGRGYRHLVQADGTVLPFASGAFAWVAALDILEHLDDESAVPEIRRVLEPGGRALVTVPAFPSLWGPQDVAARHLRRYRRGQLERLVTGAGLEIVRRTYINSLLAIPIYAARRLITLTGLHIESENTLHPGWANPVLRRIFAAEAGVVPRLSLPFGVSLLLVVRRPAQD